VKYLVTGGAGFIGSNYVQMLLSGQLGLVESVTVLDKLTYAGSLENLKSISNDPRFTFIHGDICDETIVDACIEEGVVLVHFAAESHVDRSISGPAEFIRTNVLGTQVLLSAALEKKVKLFLHVSTDEVYGSVDEGTSTETDPLLPNSPYSASKAASDLLVRSYVETFGLDARITRCCNNFGPNQNSEKFVPLAIQKLQHGAKVPLYGDGSNVREWIHVSDHCVAIQRVIELGCPGEVYNVGSGQRFSNLEIVGMLAQNFETEIEQVVEYVEDRPGHDTRYALDTKKISEIWKVPTDRSISTDLTDLCQANTKNSMPTNV
jgi:dTDP-glucose 4,6-dehydratase